MIAGRGQLGESEPLRPPQHSEFKEEDTLADLSFKNKSKAKIPKPPLP